MHEFSNKRRQEVMIGSLSLGKRWSITCSFISCRKVNRRKINRPNETMKGGDIPALFIPCLSARLRLLPLPPFDRLLSKIPELLPDVLPEVRPLHGADEGINIRFEERVPLSNPNAPQCSDPF